MKQINCFYNLFLILIAVLFINSCVDEIPNNRLNDDQREEARQLKEVERIISNAQSGKLITGIRQINSDKNEERDGIGWLLSFNDGSEITVTNGLTDGVLQIPYLRMNGVGDWTVAYNGNDFKQLRDNKGEVVVAFRDNYTPHDYNYVQYIGGNESELSLALCNSSEGIELTKITLPLELNDNAIIKCIIRDDISRELIVILYDGTIVRFGMSENEVKGLQLKSANQVIMNSENRTATFTVNVSPENAFFNNMQLKLNFRRGVWALNNGTYPFKVTSIQPAYNEFGDLLEGQYEVTVEDMGDNIVAYDEEIYLSFQQEANSDIVKSDGLNVKFESEYPFFNHTGLPLIIINIPDHKEITSKDVWTEGVEMKVYDEKGSLDYEGTLQMKGRGNTTWGQIKKPYALKLDSKSKILGMPKHKRWVLLANYFDMSSLRTETAFYMGRMSEALGYTPRTKYAEFVYNGHHKGLYQITEQLKIDDNRVNVGDDGFLIEIDQRAGQDPEDVFFTIAHLPQPVVIKDPDVVVGDENYNYLVNFMAKADASLFSTNFLDQNEGYKKYIDIESFVDWYLINEITKNNDAIFWSSCYMNLSRGGKLKMGPLWDFDLAINNYPSPDPNNVNNSSGFYIRKVAWFTRMFADPQFVALVKERFYYYYNNRQKIYDYVSEQKLVITQSAIENEIIWRTWGNGNNRDRVAELYDWEGIQIITFLEERFNWLKTEFDKM